MRHRIFRIAALLATAACLPGIAHAAADASDCANAQTQVDMNICADQDYRRADQKLNQLYKALQAKLEPDQKTRLRDTQRAWIKFRDSQCAYETIGYEGGTIEPLVHASCMAELTRQRNQTLERLLNDSNPN